ncbi:palmitoyl-protein thioesterase ABHD10, mitochondrial-like isoform X1 [Rhinoraja longicauda]
MPVAICSSHFTNPHFVGKFEEAGGMVQSAKLACNEMQSWHALRCKVHTDSVGDGERNQSAETLPRRWKFDYTGCGRSEGDPEEYLLGIWKDDVLSVLDNLTTGPQILVGSSLGGWLMLLASLARPKKVAGMVGLATAADCFVNCLNQLSPEMRKEVEETGVWKLPSKYCAKGFYTVRHEFMKELEEHCVLGGGIPVACPVRLIHGMKDKLVPWHNSVRVAEQLASEDVNIILRKDADHRMSQPEDLKLLLSVVGDLMHRLTQAHLH